MTEARVFYHIQQLEQLARRRIDACLEGESVTAGQYMVLSLIVHRGPVSSAYLARRANMTAQSMGQFIMALEHKGYVERKNDPSNRRVIQVTATQAGRDILVKFDARIDQAERDFFSGLSGEEFALLRQLLSRVRMTELGRIGAWN
jgi:DNA-binding MarR family transcriptional regulator